MDKSRHLLFLTVFLCAVAFQTSAQSFDLRPNSTQTKKADESVQSLLEKNDVAGMREYLRKNKEAANSNSRVLKSQRGSKTPVPLFFDAVQSALTGSGSSVEMCQAIIDAGCDLHPVFNGTTPIYLLMDYIATHKKGSCDTAIRILRAFDSRSDWDANQRYRSELPPMNYLMRRNHDFLNQHFSKEYIDDEVLKILVNHGASVTSYTDEGQTLMTFALETGNQYLQSYFLKQGVNLMHEDDHGHDDLYRIIESGNLSLLKDSYNHGSVKINVHTVKNEASSFSGNKDLYDFVTARCAEQASIYEDLVIFRQRFPDKKQLVANKYEALCRQESNAATDYFQIMKCVERYPDLSAITTPRKLAIYRQDCKFVDDLYVKVCITVAGSGVNEWVPYDKKVAYFLSAYDKNNYDPDHFVPKARDVENAHKISEAVHWQTRRYFDRPYWYESIVKGDKAVVNDGLQASRQPCSESLKTYFAEASTYLQQKYDGILQAERIQYERYLSYKRDQEARLSAERAQREAAREDWNKKMGSDDAGRYILEKIKDRGEWSKGRFIDTDDDFEDSREVKFNDGKSVYVYWEHRVKNGINHYGYMPDGLFNGMRWYTNFEDAVIGAYMYKYENRTWYSGRED